MLKKATLGTLPGSRALRAGAAAALIAASLAIGAGSVAASTATLRQGHRDQGSLSQGNTAAWALLIEQRQAAADAQMRKAGVGPSLAGNSTPAGN